MKKTLIFLCILVLVNSFVLAVDCITYENPNLPIDICAEMCENEDFCPSEYCDGGFIADWENGYCKCAPCTPKEFIAPEFSTIGIVVAVVAAGIGIILFKVFRKKEE